MKRSYLVPASLLAILVLSVPAFTEDEEKKEERKGLPVAEIKRNDLVDFEKEILPILQKNCLACHNKSDAESDLVLETPQAIIAGGSEGPSVERGNASASFLMKVATHRSDPAMPPKDNKVGAKNLTAEQLGLLKLWIEQGAQGEVKGASGPLAWQKIDISAGPIYAVAIAADGDYVAAGRGNQIFIYHVPTKKFVGRVIDPALSSLEIYKGDGAAHLDMVQSLAFSPDGQWLASGGFRNVKLWKRPQASKQRDLPAAEDVVHSIVASRDGKWTAIGEANGKIKLIDAEGKVAKTFVGHTGPVSGLAFSADGATLVSGSLDKTIRAWQTADAAEKLNIETPAAVNAVALVSEDKQIAVGGADNTIRTYAIEAPPAEENAEAAEGEDKAAAEGEQPVQPIKEFKGHTGPITSLAAVGETGGQLLSGSQDATLRHWDVKGGNQIRQMAHGGPVVAVVVRSDGQKFASASSNNTAKLWKAENGEQVVELKGDFRASLLAKSADREAQLAKRLADLAKKDLEEANKRKKAEEDNKKKVEESKKKADEELTKKVEAAKKPEEDLKNAQAKLDETTKAKTEKETERKKAEEAAKAAAEEAKKAKEELDKADDGGKEAAQKKLEEMNEKKKQADELLKKLQQEFNDSEKNRKQAEDAFNKAKTAAQKAVDERNAAERAAQATVRSLKRSGDLIAKTTETVSKCEASQKIMDERLKQAEAHKGEVEKGIAESEKPLTALAFSPDGALLAVACENGQVRLYGGDTGGSFNVLDGAGTKVTGLTYAGGELVLATEDKKLTSWSAAADWKLEKTIGSVDSAEAFIDRITAMHFSSDSKTLATGGGEPSRSGELKIWKVEDGSLMREVKDAHSDTIFGLEFSSDGRHVASCAGDRFMKVFEVETGNLVKSFEGHTHHVLGVSWLKDGRTLATCGADKVVKVWDFVTGDQKKTISGFGKEVTSIQFVALTENMVVGSGDKQVTTKTAAGGGGTNFGGSTGYVYCVRASADGDTVVAGGEDSVVRIWSKDGKTIINFDPPKPPEEKTAEKQAAN
ncbi:MAG: c-type cytochrome domain-containing protein [Pirellulales bacterium]